MIFFTAAAITLLLSVYIIKRPWAKSWARWAYCVNLLFIIAMLIIFGLEYKIKIKQSGALRRVVIAALDISASTGLKFKDFAVTAERIWNNYSIEIIPFSNKIKGPEGAEETGMIKSLRGIIAYISGQYDENDIAGLALITDGNETGRIAELADIDKFSITEKFPHNVVYLNPGENISFDKSVTFTRIPRFMPRYAKEVISFTVNAAGAELEGVPVDLKLNGKNIGTTFVKLKNGHGEGKFELILKQAGIGLLEASVAVDSREIITDNNRDFSLIEGVYKGFRILHISGHPSADTAFIRRGLQNIPGVDMISFYILRTNSQVNKTRESELSLIPFPTDQLFRDELDNFDLIIINDFKLSNFLNSFYINNIVKFVESGGGLLIFGGPESFLPEDYISNKFESILPIYPANNNYSNVRYTIQSSDISELTALKELRGINNLSFTGLNMAKPKDWANVFYKTQDGSPVIIGGIKGKARVLAVLSDSFWRFSYNSNIPNEAALKSMIRYALGISSMPVQIYNNAISFDNKYNLIKDDLYARIQFLKNDGTVQKENIITTSALYNIAVSDSRLMNIIIEQKGRVIESYRLLNHHEKKWHEHSYVPAGKEYLQNFAKKGNGKFIEADRNDMESRLKDIALKKPVSISEKKIVENPLYMHKAAILIFLYLIVSSFYLRSRYAG